MVKGHLVEGEHHQAPRHREEEQQEEEENPGQLACLQIRPQGARSDFYCSLLFCSHDSLDDFKFIVLFNAFRYLYCAKVFVSWD